MGPVRPHLVGLVCWILIIGGLLGIYAGMKALGTDEFQQLLAALPYPAIVAEVIIFGGFSVLIVAGICMYEQQGWARFVYLGTAIPVLIQRWLLHQIQQRAAALRELAHPSAVHHHDWMKYVLILQVIGYLLSIWILFTRRARRYYHPPLYVDE